MTRIIFLRSSVLRSPFGFSSSLLMVMSFFMLMALESCSDDSPAISIPLQPKNVLFVIVDDMGTDATPGDSIGTTKPHTPTLESLADEGITYTNVWATPTCTPTRAAMLTGHHGFDTEVLEVGDYISSSEVIIH